MGENWVRLANLSEVPDGGSHAVKLGEELSIVLFNVEGRIFAPDNQCPHMGYPLTRGTIRRGILTCDWHARSFDLKGGGCFNRECDDGLARWATDVRRRVGSHQATQTALRFAKGETAVELYE
jgi:nitrite reductase/ring-hydroxylating ferredoxin subunit|tara:strand:+ start:188 stop:556 length:369 start_codon:yes stop_codon:yes gene_type:complete